MRLFLSQRICGKRSYVKQTLLPIAAVLIFLLVFPIVLGTTIAANDGIQKPLHQWLITVLLLLFAAAVAWVLHRIGVQAHNDAWVFCMDSRESLFAVNIKELVSSKHNMRRAGVLFMIRFLSVLAKTGRMLDEIGSRFAGFLTASLPVNPMKCEYYLPQVPNMCIEDGTASVRVLATDEKWFGMTYREDLPKVKGAIAEMRAAGKYPEKLWRE